MGGLVFRSRRKDHPEVSRGGGGSVLYENLAVGAMNGGGKKAVVALFDLYRLPLGLGGGIVHVRKAGTALKGKLLDEVHLRGEGHARKGNTALKGGRADARDTCREGHRRKACASVKYPTAHGRYLAHGRYAAREGDRYQSGTAFKQAILDTRFSSHPREWSAP